MKKRFKILSFFIIFSLVAGCLPVHKGKAAWAKLSCETKSGVTMVDTADEALDIMERDGGGKITLRTTVAWNTRTVRRFSANTKIIIPEDMTMTLEGAGMQGDGNFEVSGTLDLKNSTCTVFHVTGKFEEKGRGVIVRQVVNMGTLEKSSDIAAVLTYGQKLSSDTISDTLVGNRVYKEGGWRYRDVSPVYEVGEHTVSVYYDYNKTIFTPHEFNNTVKIRVDKATPKLDQYTVPQVPQGKAIRTIQPKYTCINAYTGELVSGTLQFTDGDMVLNGLGEQQVRAVFTPNDSKNYQPAQLSLKVNVIPQAPRIDTLPLTGKGEFGQVLGDISLRQGNCLDAQTGEAVPGTWAWKNQNDRLLCGEHAYPAVFTPEDTANYRSVEAQISVVTLKKKMGNVVWPEAAALHEGQHLFESRLSFDSNEYGTFEWEDDTQVPSPDFQGAVLVFTPFDSENYDWSNVSGYDAQTRNIKKKVALSVIPKPAQTPNASEAPVSTDTPNASKAPVSTDTPNAGGTPISTDTPNASEIPASTDTPNASGAPTASEKPTGDATSSPIPGGSQVPKVTQKPTGGDGEQPVQTARPTEKPASSGGPGSGAGSQTTAGKKNPQTGEPVVIKQIMTKISGIKTPKGAAFAKKPQIASVKRIGRSVKVVLRKVKKAKYEVRYARKKNMKHAKKRRSSRHIMYLRNIKKGKKYYIQARIWKKKKGKRVYGKWSKKRRI